MTHIRFSDFYCVYTFIQVVHKSCSYRVFTAFKSLSKISHEQAASVVIVALISRKNKSRKKRHKRKVGMKPWLKRKKNCGFYETLLAELRLEGKYNYKNYLWMTSEHFEEIHQLIKDDITKENTNMRDLTPLRL